MNGYGEFTWQDGKKYFGFYVDDKKEGFGIFYWASSQKFFVGFWKDGKQEGSGKIVTENKVKYGLWKNGDKVESLNGEKELFASFSKQQRNFENLFLLSFKDLKKKYR